MRDNKLSSLTPTTYKLCIQLCRAIAAHPELRKAGLIGHVFETGRTQSRQNELRRQGKSWIKYSPHQNGSAFDLVLVYKRFKPFRITKFFWNNSRHYETVAKLASELGLHSYGLTYKTDAFHFELPIICQPESDCFTYAVVNALRAKNKSWRDLPKKVAAYRAERLQALAKKQRNIAAILEEAKKLQWITDFKRVEPLEIANDKCYVGQTKRRYLGKNPWEKIHKLIDEGKGIPGHATAISRRSRDGITVLNSHYNLAEYVITDYSVFTLIYEITF